MFLDELALGANVDDPLYVDPRRMDVFRTDVADFNQVSTSAIVIRPAAATNGLRFYAEAS